MVIPPATRHIPGLEKLATAAGPEQEEFKKQAGDLWQYLNNLSETDPQAYTAYIQSRMKEVKMSQVAIEPGHFTVKCQRKQSHVPSTTVSTRTKISSTDNATTDNITTADNTANGSTTTTTTTASPMTQHPRNYYINFCVTMRVEEPDRELLFHADKWKSLTIPMVLDDPRFREDTDGTPYCVYDIMVHPCIMERCKELGEFQEQMIQLAIDSVQQTFGPLPWKKGHKLLHKYKGIFLWDEHGRKRKDLPRRDDLGFEKKLESREQLKDLLDQVKGEIGHVKANDDTAMNLLPNKETPVERSVKIEEISRGEEMPRKVPRYWSGWLAEGIWRTQVFLPGEVKRTTGHGNLSFEKEESTASAFELFLDDDDDDAHDAEDDDNDVLSHQARIQRERGILYLETSLFRLCIPVPCPSLARWKAWFDRRQSMLYLEGTGCGGGGGVPSGE